MRVWIRCKKVVAIVLVLVMLSTSWMPTFAAASEIVGSSGIEQNQLPESELMRLLTESYGAEQAPVVLDTLQKLGLIDSKGGIVQVPILFNGKSYTLEEIKTLLADPATDLTQVAEVDGQSITLESLQKIIAIETQLAELAKLQDTSDVQISEEHLDNLEALFEQSSTEGLLTVPDAVNSEAITPQAVTLAKTAGDTYDDEVYATVTNIELNIGNGSNASNVPSPSTYGTFYVTFQLNKALDKEASFAYEMIGGSQGGLVELVDGQKAVYQGGGYIYEDVVNAQAKSGMTDGPLTRYVTDTTSGVVTFAPNITTATLAISKSAEELYLMTKFSGFTPDGLTEKALAREVMLNYFWSNFARGDYLHFHQFKNLDGIQFSANLAITSYYDNDRTFTSLYTYSDGPRSTRIQNRYYYPFVHTYEGGAYLAFTNYRNPTGSPSSIPYGAKGFEGKLNIFKLTDIFQKSDTPDILEVQAKPGIYSTGQIVPMIAKFNRPMALGMLSNSNLSKMDNQYQAGFTQGPVLQLANGDVAMPELLGDTASSNYFMTHYTGDFSIKSGIRGPMYVNQGSMSPVLGFNAVVKKGSTSDDLKVLSAHRMIDGYVHDRNYTDQKVSASDYSQNTLSDIAWNKDFSNQPNITVVPARADAFASLKTDKTEYNVGDTITFTIELDPTNGASDWVINGAMTAEELNKRLRLSIGDKAQGLVTSLDWKKGEDGLALDPPVLEGKVPVTQDTLDLVAHANTSTGSLRAKIYYNQDKNNTDAIENFIMLQDKFAPFQVANVKYIMPGDLQIEYPNSWPSGEEHVVSLIDTDATQLKFTYPKDATYISADQFEWRSNDDTIATILADGTIVPKQSGTVTFTLVAKNNGSLPQETSIDTVPIEITADGVPSVVIPTFANQVKTQQNRDATILWITNVMDKYKEQATSGQTPKVANFTVELYAGNWSMQDMQGKNPLQTWTAPETSALINATSFQIPGSLLSQISTSSEPSYTVKVSTENPDPSKQGKLLSAVAYIIVTSPAASVTLDKSMGQFITDDQGVLPLSWTLTNFDPLNKGDFEFQVTKNGQLLPDSVITFDAGKGTFDQSGISETGGSYNLSIGQVTDANRAKDVYAITIKAKNSLDSTWSYDSLYLQVYKKGAFDIQIDGQKQSAYTMSNIPAIQAMNSEQILALKRKINLAHTIGINHKDFSDLGAITDQFAWNSEDNQVAGVFYQSGKDIDDITNFSNSSYQPKQQLTLGGVGDGDTTITAKHVNTGIEAKLDLEVQTLKDKLYLFQLYPKTASEIAYTDKAGVEKKVITNADGELALYDEKGIGSDVYITSSFNNTTYTGVMSQASLKSQEGSTKTMDLYPVNILQLRQLSKVEVFFKQPDGQPYTGKVTYYGGVYKNGFFAEKTEIGGEGRTETLGADGRLEVIFDTTDFYSAEAGESNAAGLSAKDQLEFLIEAHFEGDRYYPQLYSLNGDTSPVDMVAVGSKISRLKDNESGKPALFTVNQYVESDLYKNRSYITDYKGRFGPSTNNSSINLVTEFLWWGQQVDEQASATLQNELGTTTQGQSYQTFQYPFSKWYTTKHVQLLNKDTIWLDKGKSGSTSFKVYDKPDHFVQSMTTSATLVNMIGVQEATAAEMKAKLRGIKQEMTGANGLFKGPSNNDKVTLETLALLSKLKMNVGPLSMTVVPTDDPTVFRTFIQVNQGDLTSIDKEGFAINTMKTGSKDFTPGLGDIKSFLQPSYVDQQKATANKSRSGHGGTDTDFSFGGYYIGEIKFNTKTGKWENTLLAGGFHAGGEFSYSQSWNMTVGPVPVTFSLTVGGGGEVKFATSVLFDELPDLDWSDSTQDSVNDYLTSLRVYAYIEAFGGIGFDFSIIAAKIGVFGKITVENTSTWLNRNYLANGNDRVLYGNKLALESIVGVRVVLKFLFISFSHDFASLRYSHSWMFNHWKDIQEYWEENSIQPLTAANLEFATFAYMKSIGEEPMQVIESQTLENRDYLNEYQRAWNASGQRPSALRANSSLQAGSLTAGAAAPQVMQSNAYPYSNPETGADGTIAVYLSDGGSAKVEDTVASWMLNNGNGYTDQGPIATDVPKGYGDTNLHVAGEGNLIAATWVRQNQTLNKKAGAEVTNEEIMLMNNSAEVMVSIYDGGKWTTYPLTNNQTPDVAPVVAVNQGKVLVAYRSVIAGNVNNPLDFTQSDQIVYTVYDSTTQTWSDTETVYNGTQGLVTGLSSEMLSDGRAAVVYTLNQDSNQIVYAVIDTDKDVSAAATTWRTKGVIKNLQVTEDQNANENPKLTSARFQNGEEKFILGWYTLATDQDNLTSSNIRLVAFDGNGEVDPDFVDSLSAIKGASEARIDPNFTFVRNANADKTIDKLSIIWKTSEMDVDDTILTTRDAIKAVKFGEDHDGLYVSGVLSLGTLPDYTEVDNISANYVQSGQDYHIKALILGTTYTTDTQTVGAIQPKSTADVGEEIPVHISKTISAMYTLSASYQNGFDASNIVYNPEEIIPGFDLPIQFNVVNSGMSRIEKVDLEVGGQTTTHDQLSQAPNVTQSYIATYNVPNQIKDEQYTVNVRFTDGTQLSTSGTVTLAIPDVGISEVKMLKEENGHRMLSIPMYNQSNSSLAGKGYKVRYGLYADGNMDESRLIGSIQEITDDASLQLMDQGGFASSYDFNVKSYLKTLGKDEIPDTGLNVFVHASVVDSQGATVKEFESSNNSVKMSIKNLAVQYASDPVLLTTSLSSTQTAAKASIVMQNMNMATLDSGNVLVHLLDGEGRIVESKYLVNEASKLLAFGSEEIKRGEINFTATGEALQAVFFRESSDKLDASLSSVQLQGVPITFDPETTMYTLNATDLKETEINAITSSKQATIQMTDTDGKILNTGAGYISIRQALERSVKGAVYRFHLVVKPVSPSGKPMTYTFQITNTQTGKPELALQTKGTMVEKGKYTGEVELGLSAYEVEGFDLSKAEYKVNDQKWVTLDYDGSSEKHLATLSEEGAYKVSAKVRLQSGQEYTLDTITLEIGKADGSTPTPSPNPNPNPTPTPSPEQGNGLDNGSAGSEAGEPNPAPTDPEAPIATDHPLFKTDLIDVEATKARLLTNWQANATVQSIYADTRQHWAQSTISQWIRLGVITGYPDQSFKPDRSITRAEFAALLTRLFVFKDTDGTARTTTVSFKDVDRHWALDAIETLAERGIVNGYQDGSFKPDHTITREEMVVMLMRVVQTDALPKGQQLNFTDEQQIASFAKEAMNLAVRAGILGGYQGMLRPKGAASRAETSIMLLHLLELEPQLALIFQQD
ncbi:S-layer homology domain-containing protein [Paenibacillus sp. SZ31]|uniref:S-layer homology domain-containing protein n=1 Tax=Paenibacillus sp. SZ31 TaxID=2725555 RepID=UPI00146C83E1|nr:S-layer homology domain-containing protein [Paenibacillus sp. SZ31]NMI07900.1 S-layer homology domain-containing protein [Paenibacillus sp. SZ31]